MKGSSKLLKNVFSNWAGFVFNAVIAFFLSPFVVHSLGNTYYGIWVIMMQLTGYLGILELGVRSSIVKYVAEYAARDEKTKLNQIVSSAVSIYFIIALASLLASALIAGLFSLFFKVENASLHTVRVIVVITGITVAQGFIFNTFYGILMGLQRYDLFNRVSIVSAAFRAILIVVFLKLGYGVIALAVIQLAINLCSNLAAYHYCKKQLPYLKITWFGKSEGAYKTVLGYGTQSFFVTVSQKVIYQTDSFIIGAAVGASAVTFYSIPLTMIEYMRRLVIAMTEVFVPFSSELGARGDFERIRQLLIRGTRTSILVGLPICIVYLIMGERFICLWMGTEYANTGAGALLILVIAQIFSITHLTSREILFGLALQRINAYCYGVEAIANLGLSILFVRHLGIEGVALGTAIPHIIIVLFVFPVVITRKLNLGMGEYLKKGMAPTLAPGLLFAGGCYLLNTYYPVASLPGLFSSILILFPLFAVPAWFTCLESVEKDSYRAVFQKGMMGIRGVFLKG